MYYVDQRAASLHQRLYLACCTDKRTAGGLKRGAVLVDSSRCETKGNGEASQVRNQDAPRAGCRGTLQSIDLPINERRCKLVLEEAFYGLPIHGADADVLV